MPRGGLTTPFLTSWPLAQLLAQHGQQLWVWHTRSSSAHGSPGQEQLNLASPPSPPTCVVMNACFGLDMKGAPQDVSWAKGVGLPLHR